MFWYDWFSWIDICEYSRLYPRLYRLSIDDLLMIDYQTYRYSKFYIAWRGFILYWWLSICNFSWSQGYIQYFMVGSWLLQLWRYSYYESDFIDISDYIYIRSFMESYWSTWLIGDLEGGYVDEFEDLSWLYTLPGLFFSFKHVITHTEYHDLPEKVDWLYLAFTW